MKILGFEIKRGSTETKSPAGVVLGGRKKGFSTSLSANGVNINGESISASYRTFWKMYRTNTDIFRCVEEKIQTAMKKGYELQKVNITDGKRKVTKDEAFERALGDVQDLAKKIILALEVFGDVFIRKIFNVRGQVIGFEVLDTREVSVVTDSNLVVQRYMYRRKSGTSLKVENFEPFEIVHWKYGHDWDNPIFGTTVLSTLLYDVFGDQEASMVNYFWYKNDAVPSALYIIKDTLSAEDKLKTREYIEDTLKGSHNQGKSVISDGIEDVKTIENVSGGTEDITKRKYATEKICAGLGVPRTILGYVEDVNHSNGDSQFKKFIENTIQPLERLLERIFTELSKDFSGFEFVVNSDHIDQLEQLSKIARENVGLGLWTRNEAREYMGWDKVEESLADELTVPSTTQLIENLLLGEPAIPVDGVTQV